LTGTDIFGNAVETTVFTDASGRYTFDGLVAGTYEVTQTQPEGFADGIDIGNPDWTIGNDQFSNIQLGFGETFSASTFAERPEGTSGSPPFFAGLNPIANNLISSFLSSPSPGSIYSGIPINTSGNPLTLDSNRPITGGYDISQAAAPVAVAEESCDPCASGEVTDGVPVEMALPAEIMMPIEEVIEECGECAVDGVIVEEVPYVE